MGTAAAVIIYSFPLATALNAATPGNAALTIPRYQRCTACKKHFAGSISISGHTTQQRAVDGHTMPSAAFLFALILYVKVYLDFNTSFF